MRSYFISIKAMKRIAMFGIAAFLFQAAAVRYIAEEELESVPLEYVNGKKIILDAGHGGIDGGARYYGLQEKDITLAITLALGKILSDNGAEVQYTRDSDVDYYTKGKGGKRNDLLKRIEMINGSGADAFVSIHCNADRSDRWYGAQVFYSETNEQNRLLAHTLQRLLRRCPPNNKREEKADQKILILKSSEIPGALVETGYLSNRKEASLLADQEYQENLANQIAKALAYHFHYNVGT